VYATLRSSSTILLLCVVLVKTVGLERFHISDAVAPGNAKNSAAKTPVIDGNCGGADNQASRTHFAETTGSHEFSAPPTLKNPVPRTSQSKRNSSPSIITSFPASPLRRFGWTRWTRHQLLTLLISIATLFISLLLS